MSDQTVEQIAARAASGDATALTALVGQIQDEVYRLSLRMLWHPEDAEDATQEIFVKIVTNLTTFRGESSFRTWAFRVAANHLRNVRRSRVEEPGLTFAAFARDLETGLDEIPAGPAESPDQRLLEEEVKIGCTQAMLLCLDRDERLAYILGDVFEMTSDVAGEIVGVEPATFRKRLSRARSRVREFMRAHCGLVSEHAACRCRRRVAPAIRSGRVTPGHLLFAGRGETVAPRLPVLEAVGEMEQLHEIAAIHQAHPRYRAPNALLAQFRGLLECSAPTLLDDAG